MWYYRRMLRISYTEHKTNEEVLGMMKIKRLLIDSIRKRKAKYFVFFIYIRLNLTVQEIKNTKYINDTARSMLCHINPAAYTYKGSFTLYATPEKGREEGREGGTFEFHCSYCKTHMGTCQRKRKMSRGKKVGSDNKKKNKPASA